MSRAALAGLTCETNEAGRSTKMPGIDDEVQRYIDGIAGLACTFIAEDSGWGASPRSHE
jgi:hypothetical protein